MKMILQIYLQAEQIDLADVELGEANTVRQEVRGPGEEEVEEVDQTWETVELQQIPRDQQVWLN